jgi:predicted transcriptional regulator of viral defense system
MKDKLISGQSNKILRFFIEQNQYYFDYQQAKKALPNSKDSALRELLSKMTERGLLMRIKPGLFHIIPYEEDAESYMPNWHLLSEQLVKNTNYYIGYYSALQIHQLITQPSLKEQIVVSTQIRPSKLEIKNICFQFIFHNKQHFFGIHKMWIDNYHKINCSNLEKTIIDCLFRPDYAGGIVEISKAIFLSKEKINYNTLLTYTQQFQSQAVIKRLGFLLELLAIDTNISQELQKIKTKSIVSLDTELPKSGKIITRWSIQQNVDSETIKTAIYS